ncbi:MAG: N-acetyltransferase [Fluviicola sp.]|nr:MAG: N-acetyltransferase [Fluviicola sp.]
MEFITLQTERLILRGISPEVYDYAFHLPENETREFFGFSTNIQLDLERKRYEGGLRTFNKTFLYFQLIDKKSDAIMGWCGFHTWYTDHDRAELGYGLYSDYFKRQGFMSEAIPTILEYGFNEMNLHRIEAFASARNTPSIKLLASNNFKKEGVLMEHYLIDGVYEDSEVYAVIKSN